MAEAWRGFKRDGHWDVDVNVRNFIQTNYTPYDGDESFLEGPTEATDKLWGRLQELQKEESPASQMKRDRSINPTATVSPVRSPSGLRSMKTNISTMGSPTIRISRASI